jgi:hypothetical protein
LVRRWLELLVREKRELANFAVQAALYAVFVIAAACLGRFGGPVFLGFDPSKKGQSMATNTSAFAGAMNGHALSIRQLFHRLFFPCKTFC